MGKKIWIFIAGIFTGVVLTFIILLIIANARNGSAQDINYYESPVSYEGKAQTSFEVFQVLGECALAHEVSNGNYNMYNGRIVLLIGEKDRFYSDQILNVNNPKQVGVYSYETKGGLPLTVPVIEVAD